MTATDSDLVFVDTDIVFGQSPFVSFNVLRAQGKLDTFPHTIVFGDDKGVTTIIADVDEHNVIHWRAEATLEILQKMMQAQHDWTCWRANEEVTDADSAAPAAN